MSARLVAILIVCVSGQISASSKDESSTLAGKVVTLESALGERRLKTDPEQAAIEVVLKTDDGSIVPLLRDDASRALFLDKRLRDRKAELVVKRHAGLPFVQVIVIRVEENGKFRIPEYYCDICTISVRDPRICPCCQGPMELRMRPEPGD
ncbi:MAG: hypothetical protein NVSMB14_00420 [Isosphaeraceae bacterium]